MAHPFQTVVAPAAVEGSPRHLLAASGPNLISTSLATGEIVAQWSASQTTSTSDGNNDSNRRPAKKQKNDAKSPSLSNIIKLASSPDGRNIVVVTEDKCLRVFELQTNGQLTELSQRAMPKRPCAVQILPDNATILCGDKFGDVCSLPLLPTPISEDKQNGQVETLEPHDFKPSASNLTVHTQRNRRALEAQMKQKAAVKVKEPLKFEHQLLLGHVSMLTDLTYVTREVGGRSRGYIITADRDEHIRISRAAPQAHVIEGFCLGHTEFVSKICAIPGQDLLVSGGGDDWLAVWDWPAFRLRHKIDLRVLLKGAAAGAGGTNSSDDHVAVSGIWTAPLVVGGSVELSVVVASEKSPILAIIPVRELLAEDAKPVTVKITQLDSAILDLAVSGQTVIISTDARENAQKRLQSFKLVADVDLKAIELTPAQDGDAMLSQLNVLPIAFKDDKQLDALLYNISNLRKRTGQGEGEDGADDND